jgi:glycosyltransferase involved in cell wall biosynthesis
MRIVLLTQYFPPETGAPQNRIYNLATELHRLGHDIAVFTAMPNYPEMVVHKAYRRKVFCREKIGNLRVLRSWIFLHNSRKNLTMRLLTYLSFTASSFIMGLLKLRQFDVIICESPPLFLGLSAWLLSLAKGGKMVLNVSDLWPETAEKAGLITNRTALRCARLLEEFLYRHSALVSGQTRGIVDNISSRFPRKPAYWLPNGVDFSWLGAGRKGDRWRQELGISTDAFVVLYAGILGFMQGLEVIVKAAQILQTRHKLVFVIVGEGPVRETLLQMSEQMSLRNVIFLQRQPRETMPEILDACDVGVVPLLKNPLFLGAVPSKAYEFLAAKRPILLGVEGEAFDMFVKEAKSALFFEPENAQDLARMALKLFEDRELCTELGENGYNYVAQRFDCRKIAGDFERHLATQL